MQHRRAAAGNAREGRPARSLGGEPPLCLQDGAYARGGRKDFLRDVRSVLVGAVSDEGDSRRGVMARELSALFETEWTAVSRAVDSEPPRRPVPTAAAADVEMEDARQDEESVAAGGDGWRRECADALRRWGRKQSALMLAESKQDSGARSSVLDAAAQVSTSAEYLGFIRLVHASSHCLAFFSEPFLEKSELNRICTCSGFRIDFNEIGAKDLRDSRRVRC